MRKKTVLYDKLLESEEKETKIRRVLRVLGKSYLATSNCVFRKVKLGR